MSKEGIWCTFIGSHDPINFYKQIYSYEYAESVVKEHEFWYQKLFGFQF